MGLTIQTAIIIFVCVGIVVLCLFIVFTYYCQNKFVNREEDKVHSLVEENYEDDEAVLDDGEGNKAAACVSFQRLVVFVFDMSMKPRYLSSLSLE